MTVDHGIIVRGNNLALRDGILGLANATPTKCSRRYRDHAPVSRGHAREPAAYSSRNKNGGKGARLVIEDPRAAG